MKAKENRNERIERIVKAIKLLMENGWTLEEAKEFIYLGQSKNEDK